MKGKFSVDHLPFRALIVDHRYQRSVIPARVRHLTATWVLERVGAITVSIRADGKAYVVDGQHRVLAAMELGLGDTKVLCHVYRGLTIEQEAALFLSANDARPVTPIDRFKAGLVAGDPVCKGVQKTLKKYGLHVSSSPADGAVRCVSKAIALYERDPELLDAVCAVLTESWGSRAAALEQVVFAATGMVVDRYNGEIDRSTLVKKLSGYRGGPSALAGDARGLADYKPISVTRAAAEIMVDTYNKGKRVGQVPPL